MRIPGLPRLLDGARRGLAALDEGLLRAEVVSVHGRAAARALHTGAWPETTESARAAVTPCFAVSTGRAGTMTLAAALATQSRIDSHHEPEPRLVAASYLAYLQGPAADPGFWRDALALARDRLVFGAHRRGRVYFESNNRLTLLAGPLAELYPRSRFVLLVRDPVDFVASAEARGYYRGHPWDHARLRPRPDEPDAARWDQMDSVARSAWLWERTNREALRTLDALGPERALILPSSSLFRGDLDAVERVIMFVTGREMARPRAVRRALGGVLNRQRGGTDRDAFRAAEGDRVLAVCGPLARRLRV